MKPFSSEKTLRRHNKTDDVTYEYFIFICFKVEYEYLSFSVTIYIILIKDGSHKTYHLTIVFKFKNEFTTFIKSFFRFYFLKFKISIR